MQGPDKNGNYIEDDYIREIFYQIQAQLNLKSFEFKMSNGYKKEVQLSLFLEAHQTK